MMAKTAVCMLLVLGVAYASPITSMTHGQTPADATASGNSIFGAIRAVLENAINQAEDLPDASKYPDNYQHSFIKEKTVNGSQDITNTTIDKSTKDGLQKTLITKAEKIGGKIRKIVQMIKMRKIKEQQGGSGSGEGSGEGEDMMAQSSNEFHSRVGQHFKELGKQVAGLLRSGEEGSGSSGENSSGESSGKEDMINMV